MNNRANVTIRYGATQHNMIIEMPNATKGLRKLNIDMHFTGSNKPKHVNMATLRAEVHKLVNRNSRNHATDLSRFAQAFV